MRAPGQRLHSLHRSDARHHKLLGGAGHPCWPGLRLSPAQRHLIHRLHIQYVRLGSPCDSNPVRSALREQGKKGGVAVRPQGQLGCVCSCICRAATTGVRQRSAYFIATSSSIHDGRYCEYAGALPALPIRAFSIICTHIFLCLSQINFKKSCPGVQVPSGIICYNLKLPQEFS